MEYAKRDPEDIEVRITVANRSADAATIHLLPSLWFRNTWWMGGEKGTMRAVGDSPAVIAIEHSRRSVAVELRCDGTPELLFTDNETNTERLWGTANATPYVKDAFHEYVVHGRVDAVNPARTGTKAAALYELEIPAERLAVGPAPRCASAGRRGRRRRRAPLRGPHRRGRPVLRLDHAARRRLPDEAAVMRQALASMLWSKQHYFFDLDRWLEEHHVHPLRDEGRVRRAQPQLVPHGQRRHHLDARHLGVPVVRLLGSRLPHGGVWRWSISTSPRIQLELMLHELYLHPNGQLPAYEWNFSDVNPPVHAWATLLVYESEVEQRGAGDVDWLKRAFQKLLVNFTWWVNRKDPTGRNVFEGGFLGLDNIGVFDRSSPLPTGGRLEQSDGTAWMAFFSQAMLGIALELSQHDPMYEDMTLKFAEHFVFIAAAMDRIGDNHDELWDEAGRILLRRAAPPRRRRRSASRCARWSGCCR